MKVEIKINYNTGMATIEKTLRTEIVGSFYIIYFNGGRYIYPVQNIIEIKEIFEDEEIKVLGKDNIKV